MERKRFIKFQISLFCCQFFHCLIMLLRLVLPDLINELNKEQVKFLKLTWLALAMIWFKFGIFGCCCLIVLACCWCCFHQICLKPQVVLFLLDLIAGFVLIMDLSLNHFKEKKLDMDKVEPMNIVEIIILVLIGVMVVLDVFGMCLYIYGISESIYGNRWRDDDSEDSYNYTNQYKPLLTTKKSSSIKRKPSLDDDILQRPKNMTPYEKNSDGGTNHFEEISKKIKAKFSQIKFQRTKKSGIDKPKHYGATQPRKEDQLTTREEKAAEPQPNISTPKKKKDMKKINQTDTSDCKKFLDAYFVGTLGKNKFDNAHQADTSDEKRISNAHYGGASVKNQFDNAQQADTSDEKMISNAQYGGASVESQFDNAQQADTSDEKMISNAQYGGASVENQFDNAQQTDTSDEKMTSNAHYAGASGENHVTNENRDFNKTPVRKDKKRQHGNELKNVLEQIDGSPFQVTNTRKRANDVIKPRKNTSNKQQKSTNPFLSDDEDETNPFKFDNSESNK